MAPNTSKKNTKRAALAEKSTGEGSEGEKLGKPAAEKKQFDAKFSPMRKPIAKTGDATETTIIQVVLLGESGNGSKVAILFWVVRKDGVKLACWADKIASDLVYQGNHAITEVCGVQKKIFKLHDASGNVLKGNKNFDRRCYLIILNEFPEEDEIRNMMQHIADEVNSFPTIKESQKVQVPEDLIVERGDPFVSKLGNEQTIGVCEALFAPVNQLQSYYAQNTAEFANFWKEGTMTPKLAAFFGVGPEWIIPSQLA